RPAPGLRPPPAISSRSGPPPPPTGPPARTGSSRSPPAIPVEKASDVFDINSVNGSACRFMTITCDVRPAWRKRIPAVVHVDGSARPQTIARDTNPLYYDLVSAFARETGIPVLVNTSFNVHEEPIVNTPQECAKALVDGRIDFVVTQRAIYEADGPKSNGETDRAVEMGV